MPPNVRSTTPGAFAFAVGAQPSPGYRLRRVRGRGGFAEVWEADSPSGPPVALKFIPSSNTTMTARELRSVQSFAGMEHPYLVKTHDIWSIPGYIVICMELAEGTLLDLMMLYHNDFAQPIPTDLLCLNLWQVAEALDFLNSRWHVREGRKVGFQHGDVKPNNILLLSDVAKLSDYGMSTATHGPNTPCPRQGTREYAAPEVFAGYQTDTSDQFSLAVTYHVLRTGRFPFPPPPKETGKAFVRPAPDLGAVTDTEKPALLRGLAPAPQDRFPTCRGLIGALIEAHGLKPERDDDGMWRLVKDDSPKNGSAAHRKATMPPVTTPLPNNRRPASA
ncbi:MAG: protein kinase [Planctomycetia bacterium]|nr:protein kinase [Planctomycetia bacterium]